MKLGIIGYGMIVKEFLPYLQKLDGVEIISILGKESINEQNFDFCYQQLEKSLRVSRIQTTARKKAGIIFPVD